MKEKKTFFLITQKSLVNLIDTVINAGSSPHENTTTSNNKKKTSASHSLCAANDDDDDDDVRINLFCLFFLSSLLNTNTAHTTHPLNDLTIGKNW